jgi:hypothetical protein
VSGRSAVNPGATLPAFLVQAVAANNLTAAVATARYCELSSVPEDAGRYWMRAGRLGHPEAQWRCGYAYYKGLLGHTRDSEEALLWLSRATKRLAEVVFDGDHAPVLTTALQCRAILAQAAHVLGFLHLDGEGTKQDTGAALQCFKTARLCGCTEAGSVLGSLFRNGQY